jgi:hypothetical protein
MPLFDEAAEQDIDLEGYTTEDMAARWEIIKNVQVTGQWLPRDNCRWLASSPIICQRERWFLGALWTI